MWAWGCVERVATGLLGAQGDGRWNTAVAVGVTAAAGLALVAIIVTSRRSVCPLAPTSPTLKSFLWLSTAAAYCPVSALTPMQGRPQIAAVAAQEWSDLFTPEGKLQDGGVKLLKKVRGGVGCGNSCVVNVLVYQVMRLICLWTLTGDRTEVSEHKSGRFFWERKQSLLTLNLA
jgi:hypothetical protein